MREENACKIRRQVPESDAMYQKERNILRNAVHERAFGSWGLHHYDRAMEDRNMILGLEQTPQSQREARQQTSAIHRMIARGGRSTESALKESLLDRSRELRTSFVSLAEDLIKLNSGNAYKGRKNFILGEINTMFDLPEMKDELKRHFGDNNSGLTAPNLLNKVIDGSISDELLYAVAKRHAENFREQETRFEKIVQESKMEFSIAIKKAVTEGFLPETALSSLHRLDSVIVNLHDRLNDLLSPRSGGTEISGKITVSNEELQESVIPRLKHTLFHEFLHELSGKSITIQEGIDYGSSRISHKKVGVSLNSIEASHSPNTWINEAITEWLALKLSGYAGDSGRSAYKGSYGYPTERRELDRLFDAGLEEGVVTEAYFEDFITDQPKEEKGRYFRKLFQRIADIDGKAGFARLENKYILHNIINIKMAIYNQNIYEVADGDLERFSLPPEAKVFDITVGTGEQIITRRFAYVPNLKTQGATNIPVEAQWKRIENALSDIVATYRGKAKYSVIEETSGAVNLANITQNPSV